MIRRTLAEWLDVQQTVHARGIDLELSRVTAVARKLGVDRLQCPVITVGGTNGKGSVVAFLEAIFRSTGLAPGVFTSPHLVRYSERIRVAGAEASEDELVDAFERIEAARDEITLTYFEYNTLAALLVFAAREVEVAVLEVGLGGRLDATNIVDADVAVVCSIGLDHRDWLGETLEEIGREKAGIFRLGRPAVLGSPEMPASVFESIEQRGARPVIAGRDFTWEIGAGEWTYRGVQLVLEGLPPPSLPGSVQYRNAATAITAAALLGPQSKLDFRNIREALRGVTLAGRFQIVPGSVEWILDVAHNEPAAKVLAQHLAERPCEGRTIAVASVLADKDAAAIVKALQPAIDHWMLCTLTEPRGLSAQELAKRAALPHAEFTLAGSIADGCEKARALAKPGDRVVACGSFLVVSAALQWLRLY